MKNNDMNDERFARGLGWLSVGLGLPALVAPGAVARLIGVQDDTTSRGTVAFVGVRDVALGVGLLARLSPVWLWARVAGDVMDLTLLSKALTSGSTPRRDRVAATTATIVGITAMDVWCTLRMTLRSGERPGRAAEDRGMVVKKAITVRRPLTEVYRAWRDFSNLPRFMENLESVQITGDNRSHWKAKAPAGAKAEWDAKITEDRPNERIAWCSLPGSALNNAGTVRFVQAPGGRGTEVHVEMRFDSLAGKLGATAAKIVGKDPGKQVADDLRRFKQVLETGEITRSEDTVRNGGPAQPPPDVPPSAETWRPTAEPALP